MLRLLRRCPPMRRMDDRRYDRIEAGLMGEVMPPPTRRNHVRLLYPDVVRASLKQRSDYRVIDPAALSAADLRFLADHGLALEYILANKDAFHPPHPTPAEEQPEDDFQLRAVREGSLAARCPHTGRTIYSCHAFLAAAGAPIFYRYEHQGVPFFLAVGIPGIGYQKLYFYFPRLQTVVLIRSRAFWHGRANIDALRAWLICHWQAALAYVTAPQPPVVAVLVDEPHFAHHLWNALTGIDRLIGALPQNAIPPIVVCHEPFAPLETIFPLLDPTSVIRVRPEALPGDILRQHRFPLRVGDNRIRPHLVDHLCRAAERLCNPEVLLAARQMRQRHWPILWVTIRMGNRTWVSQCAGIANLVNDLLGDYPQLALVIDGFCLPQDQPSVDAQAQVRIVEEMRCVQAIRARLPAALPVRCNVGRTFAESVLFARVADCYLAHSGSLQHKIGWIANCPGVVHSNRADLKELKGSRHRALSARPDAVLPVLLDATRVHDVGGARADPKDQWGDTVNNYDFDYRVARDALLSVIKSLSRPAGASQDK
ncbi:MAG: hypothetical protein ACUVT2_06720 [Thiobacillaceae bacterium]